MESWSGGVVEWWRGGVMERWSDGAMERWSDGAVESWSIGVSAFRRSFFNRYRAPGFVGNDVARQGDTESPGAGRAKLRLSRAVRVASLMMLSPTE